MSEKSVYDIKSCGSNPDANENESFHSTKSSLNSSDSARNSITSNESIFESSICFNKSILTMLQCEENENEANPPINDIDVIEPIQDDSTIEEISLEMVKRIVDNNFNIYSTKYCIIDVRFPYEYDGGHIKGSVNLFTPFKVLKYLFIPDFNESELVDDIQSSLKELVNQILKMKNFTSNLNIIFHCEFSSVRGPKMAEEIRCIDRLANLTYYPKLFYPKIFVMKSGYQGFYSRYKRLCEPRSYIKMDSEDQYESRNEPINKNLLINRSKQIKQISFYRKIVDDQMEILSAIKNHILAEKNFGTINKI